MHTLRLTSAAVAALALAGCRTGPEQKPAPPIPQVVTVTVREYVPVPEELTRPCAIERAREQTVGESIRLNRVRLASLEECNRRMKLISELRIDRP